MGRQHQRMDRPGVQQVPEGSGEQEKMEKTGCKIMWCPNDPRGLGIDDNDDDDDDDDGLKQKSLQKKKLLIYTKDFF